MTIVQQLPLMFLLCCQTCVLLFLLWRDMAPDVKQWKRTINDEHTCHCNVTGCGEETVQHQNINWKSKRHTLPQYIDHRNLNVILGDKSICGDVAYVHALFVVHSAVGNYQNRQAIRQIFRRDPYYKKYTIRLLFLLGQPNEMKLQNKIYEEFRQYGDVIQGVFLDTYHNLTYKAVMGMKWISQNCRNVKYIVKMDDDVYVDLHNFFTHLYNPFRSSDHTVICRAMLRGQVKVNRKGKWGVEKNHLRYYKQFPFSYCSGFAVVMPAAMIPVLYKATLTVPFFWIDDIYLFGMARGFIRKSVLHDITRKKYFEHDIKKNWKCLRRAGCELVFACMSSKLMLHVWKERQKYLKHKQ
ncbi:beta-1,3-galactosyltransferase 1-like [Haliotis cracherodii]|uniref:beta-1,3-galactosyltransferase 1-like n=1 Tax=Haliotis cracherodii TaxID=6455 RepID=UPI0039EAF7B2